MAAAISACGQNNSPVEGSASNNNPQVIDKAPYASVTEADAPTVKALEASGYSQVDHYPVGCVIPDQPAAACDATGAVFMDRREFADADIAVEDEEYSQYEYVCPAIDSEELAAWKCRKQESSNG